MIVTKDPLKTEKSLIIKRYVMHREPTNIKSIINNKWLIIIQDVLVI